MHPLLNGYGTHLLRRPDLCLIHLRGCHVMSNHCIQSVSVLLSLVITSLQALCMGKRSKIFLDTNQNVLKSIDIK